MEEADCQPGFNSGWAPPSVVTLSPFSPIVAPSSRRLSSHFTPSCAVPSARKLAWVSLQGRLVNAEEASSAKAIGGGLSREERVAWELFSPVQRILIVAVIGVAAAESKKNRFISQLKKSVELRDQVLLNMQQKLDDLCEQLNTTKKRPEIYTMNIDSLSSDGFSCEKIKFVDCGCWHCDHHQNLFADAVQGNSVMKLSRGEEEVLQYKIPLLNEVEQEERRMSDLSDWASSVTSSAEFQMNISTVDQDICNLKRECEEKDDTIKELTSFLQSNNMASSKRTAELEDIIRRKNSMITKLKRDILVLEQKLVHLTRLRRPSSSSLSIPESWQLPLMVENIVYDMDSTTSPSSSDSDSSPVNRSQAPVAKNQVATVQHSSNRPSPSDSDASNLNQQKCFVDQILGKPLHSSDTAAITHQKSAPAKALGSLPSLTEWQKESRPATPLKEISSNQKPRSRPSSSRSKQLSASGELKNRRRAQTAPDDAISKKRWV